MKYFLHLNSTKKTYSSVENNSSFFTAEFHQILRNYERHSLVLLLKNVYMYQPAKSTKNQYGGAPFYIWHA